MKEAAAAEKEENHPLQFTSSFIKRFMESAPKDGPRLAILLCILLLDIRKDFANVSVGSDELDTPQLIPVFGNVILFIENYVTIQEFFGSLMAEKDVCEEGYRPIILVKDADFVVHQRVDEVVHELPNGVQTMLFRNIEKEQPIED